MTMTNDEAVKVLADHNEWRRGNDDFPATNPTKLGLAIEVAIAALSAQEPVAWFQWRNAEDIGRWSYFHDKEEVWANCPWTKGQDGEWSTEFGNASADEIEPTGWLPLYAAPPAQADILAEYELWAVRMMVAKTDELNDAAVDKLDSLWRKMTPEQRGQANETSARYSAELQQADTKQAEPLRVTREQLSAAWRAGLAATDKGCADWADEMLAALHQLGAKVEVSDG